MCSFALRRLPAGEFVRSGQGEPIDYKMRIQAKLLINCPRSFPRAPQVAAFEFPAHKKSGGLPALIFAPHCDQKLIDIQESFSQSDDRSNLSAQHPARN